MADIRKFFTPKAAKSGTPVLASQPPSLKATPSAKVAAPILKKHTESPAKSKKPTPVVPEKRPQARSGRKNGRAKAEDEDYEVGDEADEEEEWGGKDGEAEEEEEENSEEDEPAAKKVRQTGGGRGRGKGKGNVMTVTAKVPAPAAKAPATAGKGKGRGRGGGGGGGWGGFMQERAAPPHKGEKEVPRGPEDALQGLTIVISGALDSLEREEAEELIKTHGGRVTGSISKKTSYLLADEDVGGSKSRKAKEIGVPFLTEDGLFALINEKAAAHLTWKPPPPTPQPAPAPAPKRKAESSPAGEPSSSKQKVGADGAPAPASEVWAAKYAPRSLDEVVANPSLLNQMRSWLKQWENGVPSKKALLLSGPPGIGKTTSARLSCREAGLQALEVNASDTRGKASSKVGEGLGGKLANVVKEMVTNSALRKERGRPCLIMDEVDGMSGGDRGGVTDLIASIKASTIPIIAICNDRYDRKLQSLVNHCLALNFRKPTKQQMAKRLRQVASEEGLEVADSGLEELGERVNGDMRMAMNQLEYMAIRSRHLSVGDLKSRALSSWKDEELRPMGAVDKLMSPAASRERLDAKFDAAMSDIDLVPLMVQENYLNHRPATQGTATDPEGVQWMDLIARAADSISDGDRVNVVVRRYQRWQHLPFSAFMSCVLPGELVHGPRTTLLEGEMNFTRFPGWLGKNSTAAKNRRLLQEMHAHLLASRLCAPNRQALRLDYMLMLGRRMTEPLKSKPKAEGVEEVGDLLTEYSLTLDDMESVTELLKFKGMPLLTDGIPSAVKAQLTRDFKKRSHRVKAAALLPQVFGGRAKKKKMSKRSSPLLEGGGGGGGYGGTRGKRW